MRKFFISLGAAGAAMCGLAGLVAFAATTNSQSQATADALAAFARRELAQIPPSAKSNRVIKALASSLKINISAGATEEEKYYLAISNFQLAASGVGHTEGAAMKAIFSSRADFADMLNGRLSAIETISKGKATLKGIGLINKLKVRLLVSAIKKLAK